MGQGPQARDFRGTFVELGAKVRPDRRAGALPAKPRIDGEPHEVLARIEPARLVVDLAVADRCVLLVDRDDADLLVAGVVPPAVLFARTGDRDIALLGESSDPDECRVIAVREEPDPMRHTRRPGRTPASRMERSVGSSSPIVVIAP